MISRERFKQGLKKARRRTRAAFWWKECYQSGDWFLWKVAETIKRTRKNGLPIRQYFRDVDWKFSPDRKGRTVRERRQTPLEC